VEESSATLTAKPGEKKKKRKNRIILKAKQQKLQQHINEFNPNSSSTKTWAFAKARKHGQTEPNHRTSSSHQLIIPVPTSYPSNQNKKQKSSLPTTITNKQNTLQRRLRRSHQLKIRSEEHCGLNSKIKTKELEFGISNLKSQAMGRDLVHNNMLKNLNDQTTSSTCSTLY
jgi:hypothetical protein